MRDRVITISTKNLNLKKFTDAEFAHYKKTVIKLEHAYSGHLPSSLHIWKTDDNLKHKKINETLYLLDLPNWLYGTERYLTATSIATIQDFSELYDYCVSKGIESLKDVPIVDGLVQKIENMVKISKKLSDTEYVYRLENLVAMKGGEYATLRSKVRHFSRLYPDSEFIFSAKTPNRQTIKEIDKLYEVWHDFNSEPNQDISYEKQALEKYLSAKKNENSNILDKTIHYYLYVNTRLVGFAVIELINSNYAVGHFLKLNLNLSGASEYFIHSICTSLLKDGIEYLNAQEDLGVDGLRKFKQKLRPFKMINTYDVVFE